MQDAANARCPFCRCAGEGPGWPEARCVQRCAALQADVDAVGLEDNRGQPTLQQGLLQQDTGAPRFTKTSCCHEGHFLPFHPGTLPKPTLIGPNPLAPEGGATLQSLVVIYHELDSQQHVLSHSTNNKAIQQDFACCAAGCCWWAHASVHQWRCTTAPLRTEFHGNSNERASAAGKLYSLQSCLQVGVRSGQLQRHLDMHGWHQQFTC